jgi:heme A synthase
MKNRGEEKSDGSREAAATKCFLSVLFFSCRLIVNVVRRRKKRKMKTTTMMMMVVVVVVVGCSRVLRTTVRISTTKHCRRSMMLLTHSTFYLMTCWCCIQPFGRCSKKKRKERKKEKKREEQLLFLFFLFLGRTLCMKQII